MNVIIPKEIDLVNILKAYGQIKDDSKKNNIIYQIFNCFNISLISFEKGDLEKMWIHYLKLRNLIKKIELNSEKYKLMTNILINLIFCSFIQILIRFLEVINDISEEIDIKTYFKEYIFRIINNNDKQKLSSYIIYQYLFCFNSLGIVFYCLKQRHQYSYSNFYKYLLLLYLSYISKENTNINLKNWFNLNIISMNNRVIKFQKSSNNFKNNFYNKNTCGREMVIALRESNHLDILKSELFVSINNKNQYIYYKNDDKILGSLFFLKDITCIQNGFFVDKYMKCKNFINIYCYITLADFYNKDYHATNNPQSLKLCNVYLDNCYKYNKNDLIESIRLKFYCGYCLCCENDMKSSDPNEYLITPIEKMKKITSTLDNIKSNVMFNDYILLFLSYAKFISYKNINPNENICYITDYVMKLFIQPNKLYDKVKIRIFLLVIRFFNNKYNYNNIKVDLLLKKINNAFVFGRVLINSNNEFFSSKINSNDIILLVNYVELIIDYILSSSLSEKIITEIKCYFLKFSNNIINTENEIHKKKISKKIVKILEKIKLNLEKYLKKIIDKKKLLEDTYPVCDICNQNIIEGEDLEKHTYCNNLKRIYHQKCIVCCVCNENCENSDCGSISYKTCLHHTHYKCKTDVERCPLCTDFLNLIEEDKLDKLLETFDKKDNLKSFLSKIFHKKSIVLSAVSYNSINCLKYFHSIGIKMNNTDIHDGLTPFHVSLITAKIEIINYYLENVKNYTLDKKIRISENSDMFKKLKDYFLINPDMYYESIINNVTIYDFLLIGFYDYNTEDIDKFFKILETFKKRNYNFSKRNMKYHISRIKYNRNIDELINKLEDLFKLNEIIIKPKIEIIEKKVISREIVYKNKTVIPESKPKIKKIREKVVYEKEKKNIVKCIPEKKKKKPLTRLITNIKKKSPKNKKTPTSLSKKKKSPKTPFIESGFVFTQKFVNVNTIKSVNVFKKVEKDIMRISVSLKNYVNDIENNNDDQIIDCVYYIQGHNKTKLDLVTNIIQFCKDKNEKSVLNKICINIGLGSTRNFEGKRGILKNLLFRLSKIKKQTVIPINDEEKLFKNLYPDRLDFNIKYVESVGNDGIYYIDKRLIGVEIN